MNARYPYELPPLPFGYEDLCPFLGERTMQFHHDKHFKTYVDNLNTALADSPEYQSKTLTELLRNLDRIPEPKRTAIRNNGGGVYNHALYFDGLLPGGGERPQGELAAAMERAFGPWEEFKARIKQAAVGQFGSGYAFLVTDQKGGLSIVQCANQDCPLSQGLYPLLCVDVWEHAYYLDYQNLRANYVEKWLDAIHWSEAAKRYTAVL